MAQMSSRQLMESRIGEETVFRNDGGISGISGARSSQASAVSANSGSARNMESRLVPPSAQKGDLRASQNLLSTVK